MQNYPESRLNIDGYFIYVSVFTAIVLDKHKKKTLWIFLLFNTRKFKAYLIFSETKYESFGYEVVFDVSIGFGRNLWSVVAIIDIGGL